jgi:DNA polymerase V
MCGSLKARHRHIVVAVLDGEMTVKRLYLSGGRMELRPENPAYTLGPISNFMDVVVESPDC